MTARPLPAGTVPVARERRVLKGTVIFTDAFRVRPSEFPLYMKQSGWILVY